MRAGGGAAGTHVFRDDQHHPAVAPGPRPLRPLEDEVDRQVGLAVTRRTEHHGVGVELGRGDEVAGIVLVEGVGHKRRELRRRHDQWGGVRTHRPPTTTLHLHRCVCKRRQWWVRTSGLRGARPVGGGHIPSGSTGKLAEPLCGGGAFRTPIDIIWWCHQYRMLPTKVLGYGREPSGPVTVYPAASRSAICSTTTWFAAATPDCVAWWLSRNDTPGSAGATVLRPRAGRHPEHRVCVHVGNTMVAQSSLPHIRPPSPGARAARSRRDIRRPSAPSTFTHRSAFLSGWDAPWRSTRVTVSIPPTQTQGWTVGWTVGGRPVDVQLRVDGGWADGGTGAEAGWGDQWGAHRYSNGIPAVGAPRFIPHPTPHAPSGWSRWCDPVPEKESCQLHFPFPKDHGARGEGAVADVG